MLFDWLVTGGILATNPATSVRGPKHVIKRGKTPVLTIDQARVLIESIDTSTLVGLRDRALIGVMTYAFARIGAVVAPSSPCGSTGDHKGSLFRSARGRSGELNGEAMHRVDARRMIQRRAGERGLKVKIGCHTFRATGISLP
jgi:hypothetical protein